MRFFDPSDLDQDHQTKLDAYDAEITGMLAPTYTWPVRLRCWELTEVMRAAEGMPRPRRALETGAVNTFLGLWLASRTDSLIVSDLYRHRLTKNIMRRTGILKHRPNEAPIERWYREARRPGNVSMKTVDLTRIKHPDDTFDLITSVSVIEHIPACEQALSEMYRCLAPGGKLLITTDIMPEPQPYLEGTRYFSHDELKVMFAPYPVTSVVREPDFKKDNWQYLRDRPILTGFIEVTKPTG